MVRQYNPAPPLSQGNNSRSVTVDTLLPGDIIISTIENPSSIVIRAYLGDEVSHAMLYIGNGEVVESIPGEGVRRVWLQEALDESSVAVAFRHPEMNYQLAEVIVNAALDYERNGTGYDYLGAVTAGSRDCIISADNGTCMPGFNDNNRLYCTELIVDAFSKANLDLVGYLSKYSLPGDFAQIAEEGEIDYVGHIIACEGIEHDLSVHQDYVYTAGDQISSENDNTDPFLNSDGNTCSVDYYHPDQEVYHQSQSQADHHAGQENSQDPFLDSGENTCSVDYYSPGQEVYHQSQSQTNTPVAQEDSEEEVFHNGDDGETPFN